METDAERILNLETELKLIKWLILSAGHKTGFR